VPAYIVFSDVSLRVMARDCPTPRQLFAGGGKRVRLSANEAAFVSADYLWCGVHGLSLYVAQWLY
jgi:hypothetical protein